MFVCALTCLYVWFISNHTLVCLYARSPAYTSDLYPTMTSILRHLVSVVHMHGSFKLDLAHAQIHAHEFAERKTFICMWAHSSSVWSCVGTPGGTRLWAMLYCCERGRKPRSVVCNRWKVSRWCVSDMCACSRGRPHAHLLSPAEEGV